MPKLSDEFQVPLSREEAVLACRDTAGIQRWKVAAVEPERVLLKIGFRSTANPSKLEVLLNAVDSDSTLIRINGSIAGLGPIQQNHLTGYVRELRRAVEEAAATEAQVVNADAGEITAGLDAGFDLDHLTKLAALRESGALTDEEFAAKKKQILGD